LFGLLLSLNSLVQCLAPAGAQLHVRLTSAVGSYASRPGSPVRAVLIAPVIVDGATLVSAGSTLSGRVKAVTRVGLGIRHETAGLDLDFDQLTSPDGSSIPLAARVAEVDNGRERVTPNGHIHGIRATDSPSYRVSGYLRMLLPLEVHAVVTGWAIKSLIGELPEPEIYYPAGAELTLTLTGPVFASRAPEPEQAIPQLTDEERAGLDGLVSALPDQTFDPNSGRTSDLTNVLLIGSEDQISTAFEAAGWTRANPASLRHRIRWIRAVAERHGDGAGPMSSLLLRDEEPDMSWEKGLNDVSKRHHVRIWRAGAWRGREIWIGAATRDIDFAYLRPGQALTHKIDEKIDQERDKVAYDLAFTSCSNLLDWTERPGLPRIARNGTGDSMITDTRVAVIGLEDCASPRLSTETVDAAPIPAHGSGLQRFVRRELLSARNDLIRTNPYWRSFEGARFLVSFVRRRWRQNLVREAENKSQTASLVPRLGINLPPSNPGTIRTTVAP